MRRERGETTKKGREGFTRRENRREMATRGGKGVRGERINRKIDFLGFDYNTNFFGMPSPDQKVPII